MQRSRIIQAAPRAAPSSPELNCSGVFTTAASTPFAATTGCRMLSRRRSRPSWPAVKLVNRPAHRRTARCTLVRCLQQSHSTWRSACRYGGMLRTPYGRPCAAGIRGGTDYCDVVSCSDWLLECHNLRLTSRTANKHLRELRVREGDERRGVQPASFCMYKAMPHLQPPPARTSSCMHRSPPKVISKATQ